MKRDPNGGRLVGADLGDFIVGEFLSSGGQASVHRGRHKPPIDAPVAIKFLHPLYAADPDIVDSFRDEARTTGMMSHPNIVKVLAFGQLEELPWLAMEFVDGADLASLLERRAGPMPSDPMPMKTAIVILRDAGLALEHAHSHNVIHRDVKPSNVLISRSGDVKLSDFGIARATHASRRTAPGTLKGSLAYMSPEQTRRESLDIPGGKRSDIFSMGIVAYELLAGVHPFLRNDPEKIIEAIRTYEPRSLSTYDRPLPNAVVLLVEEMLKKNPRERWDEIGKAVEVLEGAIQDLGVRGARDLVASFQRDPLVTSGNPGSGSPDPVPEENGKSTPWRRWLLVGASLAVVASGAWWVWHRGENTGGAPADTVETIVPQPTDRPSPHVPPETTVVQNVQDHPSGEATTFERTYRINTKPGAATVYVDGEPTSHDLAFDVKLREGQHQFRVVHEQLGIDLTLKYLVRSGDSAKTLLLDYAIQQVEAKP